MKIPKYIDNKRMCLVKLYCHDTGRWSLLPTCGVTNVSDNTCWWDDFKAYCRRVGLKRDAIDEMSYGRLSATFEPIGVGGFAPICVTRPPNAERCWSIGGACWCTPSMWITDEKYEED